MTTYSLAIRGICMEKNTDKINDGDIPLQRQKSGEEPIDVTQTPSNKIISEELKDVLLASPNFNGNKTLVE